MSNRALTLLCQLADMSNYIRPKTAGASVFFTVSLAVPGDDLLLAEIGHLREAVRLTRAERPFTINAWVVLPDHLHAIWTLPADDDDYATRWRLIKARFSMALPMGQRRASHIARQERGIWARRFWEHHLRSAADFEAHYRGCYMDPVRHGLVDDPEDWTVSSFHHDRAYRMAS